jgi:hypothetical protein
MHARELEAGAALAQIEDWARGRANDARWMREHFAVADSFADLMWQQSRLWSGS